MMLKIKEAIAQKNKAIRAENKKEGRPPHLGEITNRTIGDALWPDSVQTTRDVNVSNLTTGKTKTLRPEWIVRICEITGVNPNFLFGWKQKKG